MVLNKRSEFIFYFECDELDNKGQAEAVFRLMIDSIIGLAILMIIIAAIGYFDELRFIQSTSDFKQLIKDAVNSPDGTMLSAKELTFKSGTGFSADDFELFTVVNRKCFSFSSSFSSVEVSSDAQSVLFKQRLITTVSARCVPNTLASTCNSSVSAELTSPSECCFNCEIYFGKTPTK